MKTAKDKIMKETQNTATAENKHMMDSKYQNIRTIKSVS